MSSYRGQSRRTRIFVIAALLMLAGIVALGSLNTMLLNGTISDFQRSAQIPTGSSNSSDASYPTYTPGTDTGTTSEMERVDEVTSHAATDAAMVAVTGARSIDYRVSLSAHVKNLQQLMGKTALAEVAAQLMEEDWAAIVAQKIIVTAEVTKVTPVDETPDDGRTLPGYVLVEIARYQTSSNSSASTLIGKETWRVSVTNGGQGWVAYSIDPYTE